MREVWATKHRPSILNEFVGQKHIINEFSNVIHDLKSMQHYIFYSPQPGTGKTTLAHILSNQLGYQIVTGKHLKTH